MLKLSRTFFTGIGLSIFLAFFSSSSLYAQAAQLAIPPETIKAFLKESPLSQKDIDTFITLVPKAAAACESKTDDDDYDDCVLALLRKAGVSKIRSDYVDMKIGLGLAVINQPTMVKAVMQTRGVPENLAPTQAEISLVKKNKAAIENGFTQGLTALSSWLGL